MEEPPPLVSFGTFERFLKALDPETRASDEADLRGLRDKGFPLVTSTKALGVLFGYRPQFIGTMRRRPHRYYNTFEIRKGNKKRVIQAPRVAIKVIQKWFGHYLSRSINLPSHVVGFVPGRSSIQGAAQHCNAEWIFSTDIERFFQSTACSMVIDSLSRIGYTINAANLITDLNCLNGALAQGSPSSPVLSNLCLHDIDVKLERLAKQNSATFTRYADDIVISGKGTPPKSIREQVSTIFEPTCWKLSEHKTRISSQPHRLKVYGLLVHQDRPRLTKGYRKKIRSIIHQLKLNKVSDENRAKAEGHLAYAKSVEEFEIS